MLAAARDATQWRALAGRLRPFGRSGESLRKEVASYGLLVVSVVLCLLAAFALREWLAPGAYAHTPVRLSWSVLSALALAALLDQGAVLEEAGWRGYATPLLQQGVLDPLRAALLVGVLWGLWHVPRDVVAGLVERFGLLQYTLLYLPSFILGTVSVSIVAAYFMNRLGGSLIPAIMVHGLSNDAVGFGGMATIERALTPDHQLTKALPFLALSIGIVAVAGRALARRPESPQAP
jgi:membrane protease YdiL (CAAX protease family)